MAARAACGGHGGAGDVGHAAINVQKMRKCTSGKEGASWTPGVDHAADAQTVDLAGETPSGT